MKRRTEFFLDPIPPFRLDLTVWALRRLPGNVVDRWDGYTYRRVLSLPAGPVEVVVQQIEPPATARLKVTIEGLSLHPKEKTAVVAILERMLGLRVDLTEFYRFAATQRQLRLLAQPFRGMKPPRYETIFESVITAIASQLVTRTVSILVLNRLAERYGVPISSGDLPARAFPVPHDLAGLSPSDLRRLGFSRQKGRAIIELARAVSTGELELERLAELPDAEAIKQLLNLRGIGRWSAGYVLLRGLGRIEVFPGDDVGARNNLQRWLHLVEPPDYAAVRRVLKRWYPYGGLIYFHMLLNRLSEAGHFK